jgi:hypothetical protein
MRSEMKSIPMSVIRLSAQVYPEFPRPSHRPHSPSPLMSSRYKDVMLTEWCIRTLNPPLIPQQK